MMTLLKNQNTSHHLFNRPVVLTEVPSNLIVQLLMGYTQWDDPDGDFIMSLFFKINLQPTQDMLRSCIQLV